MKTRFLMLLAALLLGSASAFAQSGNNEPLKGDVNGDGKVDVADITAVIKIMKDGGGTSEETTYYLGTLTEDQLTNQSYVNSISYNQTGTKPSTMTMPSSVPNGSYVVLIYPNNWGNAIITKDTYGTGDMDASDAGISNPPGKILRWWASMDASATVDVSWK